MLKIGLTGGIGSGKSTVARVFEILGVPVFYADEYGKAAYNDPQIRMDIQRLLGPDVVSAEGINRPLMRELLFNNEALLDEVSSIVHPWVKEQYDIWLKKHAHHPYVIREAAILIESGAWRTCDQIILITAPEKNRIQRVVKRDHSSEESIKQRIHIQMTDEERMKYCQHVWPNDDRFPLLEKILLFDNYIRA